MKKRYSNNNGSNSRIFVVLSFLLSLLVFFHYGSYQPYLINEQALQYMLKKGEVEKVLLIKGRGYAKVVPTKSALHKREHRQLARQSALFVKERYYAMEIASVAVFDEHYRAMLHALPANKRIIYQVESDVDLPGRLSGWIMYILLFLIVSLLLRYITRGMIDDSGGDFLGIGRSKAILWGKKRKVGVTFDDIAGMEEEKEELREIVNLLKNQKRATSLGGRLPKGVLLEGPPGTGKTLLARAVAGETKRTFFSISGPDFVEIFVGVGAMRVEKLFKEAKKHAPAVIFIDEIDAIGARRDGRYGGNEERSNTLNKLLVEMDGFDTNSQIIVFAATNRANILDPALQRSGRLDRKITVQLPTLKCREAIFKLYVKKLKISSKVSPAKLAEQTTFFSGADIDNVCNEAALLAARKKKAQITMEDFQDAIDRIIGGLEKKNKLVSKKEKQIVSYHEAGHALTSWFLPKGVKIAKVSIVSRGHSLGYVQYNPQEKSITQESEIRAKIYALLGGRAAEEVKFGEISTGAVSDLEYVRAIVYDMIKLYGMRKEIGHFSFPSEEGYQLTRSYSEATAQIIDETARKIVEESYAWVLGLLREKRDLLEKLAEELEKKEVLFPKDLERILGPRPVMEEDKLAEKEEA